METCHLDKSPWNMEILKDQVEWLKKKLKNRKISDTGKERRKYFKQKQLHSILAYNFYHILNKTTR